MNGTRMNQLVAPTSFMTSISRRRANIAMRIVLRMSRHAAMSSTDAAPNDADLISRVTFMDRLDGVRRRTTT